MGMGGVSAQNEPTVANSANLQYNHADASRVGARRFAVPGAYLSGIIIS
jgi:hypothetical protein